MNRITGFFGGGKKSNDDGGMGPEKTDMAVGAENFGGGDFGGGGMSAPRVGGAPPGQAATQAELQRAVVAEQQRALDRQRAAVTREADARVAKAQAALAHEVQLLYVKHAILGGMPAAAHAGRGAARRWQPPSL